MNYPNILSVPAICAALGVKHAVICPGSRSAPLTVGFARNEEITCKVIPDERSAAFIALGMAQQLKSPVVLICTSGSAALNFAPAIAEAFFQQIPLLVFTADRPPEWIDQLDGQTIRQTNIYGHHVKVSLNAPVDTQHTDAQWHLQRLISEAYGAANNIPKGPAHINFPFREPLYTDSTTTIDNGEIKTIKITSGKAGLSTETLKLIEEKWLSYHKKLMVCGQIEWGMEEINQLKQLIKDWKIPVVGDIIANLHQIEGAISHPDVFINADKSGLKESLQPDLLITCGKSVLSKHLKQLLRSYKPKEHWHIQLAGAAADTFQSLTQVLQTDTLSFLQSINQIEKHSDFNEQKQENYFHIWQIEERKAQRLVQNFFPKEPLGEMEIVAEIIGNLPNNTTLHLANSMSVRYANFIGLKEKRPDITVRSNRGTSGIDGCTSTALGTTLVTKQMQVLITGDLAFFYDRNAFWHNYEYNNLRVIVLNNHSGTIFRMIKGPDTQPELETYFETEQKLTAKHLANEFGIDYLKIDKRSKLKNYINSFFEDDGKAKILEIESLGADNKKLLGEFKQAFNELK